MSEEETTEINHWQRDKNTCVVNFESLPAKFDLVIPEGSVAQTLVELIYPAKVEIG